MRGCFAGLSFEPRKITSHQDQKGINLDQQPLELFANVAADTLVEYGASLVRHDLSVSQSLSNVDSLSRKVMLRLIAIEKHLLTIDRPQFVTLPLLKPVQVAMRANKTRTRK